MSALITEEELYNHIPEKDSLIEQSKELRKNKIKQYVKEAIEQLKNNPHSAATIIELDKETREVIAETFRKKGYVVNSVKDSIYHTVPSLIIQTTLTRNEKT